jgi:hypothetical protein
MPTGKYRRVRHGLPPLAEAPDYERRRKAAYRARIKKAELIAEAQAHARAVAYEDGLT